MLRREITIPITSAGTHSGGQDLNLANAGVTILKVFDNITLSDSQLNVGTGLTRLKMINNRWNGPRDRMNDTTPGRPQTVRMQMTSLGTYVMYFYPYPDKAYYLYMPCKILPAAMTSDNDIPWYPNDETMVQLVRFKALEFVDAGSPEMTLAQQQLAALLSNDRVRYGQLDDASDNEPMGMLDRAVFKNRIRG